ncbi:hypothetical protein EDD86DRAFT_192583 [Gorgonomyces haynaldii]|nr:hypothetical protein EDD86DRAFT_192583 [Gorgonomyces haynaldii]
MATALYDLATFPLIDSDRHKRAFEGLSITEEEICILSVRCLEGLLRFESVGELLHTLDFSVLICGLLQTERPRLVRNVLQSLTKLIEEPYFGRTLTARPLLFFIILKAVTLEGDPRIWADFRHFASILARGTVFEPIAIGYAHVHRSLATADIIVNHQTFEVYNRSWSFESVRCSHGVSENGKYAYEFVLGSDGIIQIGWCTLDCVFEPYTGQGVGDDQESYSFDGCRTKIWHAKQFSNNEYGSVWKSGDAVVCLLDLDQRTISFMLNGRHLGIAFTDVDSSKQWFPAASFTNEEWGRFCFGSRLDPLEFCPPDHVPIGKFEQEKIFLEIDTDGQSQSKSPTSSKSVQFSEPVTPFDGVVEADMYSPTLYPRSGIVRRERVSVSDKSKYQHFGIITQGVVIYTLVLFREHNTVALCKLEPQEYESDEPFSQVLDQYLDTLFDDNDAETPPFLQLLDMVHNVRIREADVLGCGIFMMRQTIFFTLNGILLGEEIRLEDKTCCVPYIRDFSRYIINYGDLPFEYEYANVDRDSILSCILDQSKG